MTLVHTVKHNFVSLKPDGSDGGLVRPSNWNAPHDIVLTVAANTILGRGGSAGPVQELQLGGEFNVSGGVISVTAAIPIGIIMDYGANSAPNGWLLCNGQLYLRDEYAQLFGIIGETFGAGDGFSTFAVPDLRGRATFGRDTMGASSAANRLTNTHSGLSVNQVGSAGGFDNITLTEDQMPEHDHGGATIEDGIHNHFQFSPETSSDSAPVLGTGFVAKSKVSSDNQDYLLAPSASTATLGRGADSAAHTHDISVAGNSEAHENLPPMMVVSKIIFSGVFT